MNTRIWMPTLPRHRLLPAVLATLLFVSLPGLSARYGAPAGGGSWSAAADQRAPTACQFTKTAAKWTLKKSCTTKTTIKIPRGVDLDGNDHTIRVATPGGESGVSGDGGLLRNLRIVGADLVDPCRLGSPVGIEWKRGRVRNVSVSSLPCGVGIRAYSADLDGVSVSGVAGGRGIELRGVSTVSDSTVRDAFLGIFAVFSSKATIDGNTIDDVFVGVFVTGTGSADVTDNTVVGLGPREAFPVGVIFDSGTSGSITGNAISNFYGVPGEGPGCGIRVRAAAGAVVVGTNRFPPPGNEEDICEGF